MFKYVIIYKRGVDIMFEYDKEKKKVDKARQQLYRDYAIQYNEIQKSDLSETEKEIRISELTGNVKEIDQILSNTVSLSDISNEDKEDSLKISENIKTQEYYDTKYKRDMFIYKIILSFLVVLTSVALTYIQSMRKYKIVTRTYYD